ncbi:MAG: DUF5305 family protein [Halobacteriota archaeon]
MTNEPTKRELQFRDALQTYFPIAIIGLLILLAVGAGATYVAYADPGTETVERSETSWTLTTGYDHGAEVTESNEVFPLGTELTGRSTYFTRVAPVLEVSPSVSFQAPQSSDVTVTLDSELVIRGTSDDQTLWEQRDELGTTEAASSSGERVELTHELDIPSVVARLDAIDDDLGSPGSMDVLIRSTAQISGEIDGESVSTTRSFDLGVDPGSNQYHVDTETSDTETFDRTVTETVPIERGLLWELGGPALVLVSLLGLVGLAIAAYRDVPGISESERDYLAFLGERSKFDEWITRIHLPDSVFERPTATAHSLTDLVDYAIDNETGVIENPDTGRYVVLGEEYVFTYDPPSPAADGDAEDVFELPFELASDTAVEDAETEEE